MRRKVANGSNGIELLGEVSGRPERGDELLNFLLKIGSIDLESFMEDSLKQTTAESCA
jgi:hypothetical protein